jgi:hypothetical protein
MSMEAYSNRREKLKKRGKTKNIQDLKQEAPKDFTKGSIPTLSIWKRTNIKDYSMPDISDEKALELSIAMSEADAKKAAPKPKTEAVAKSALDMKSSVPILKPTLIKSVKTLRKITMEEIHSHLVKEAIHGAKTSLFKTITMPLIQYGDGTIGESCMNIAHFKNTCFIISLWHSNPMVMAEMGFPSPGAFYNHCVKEKLIDANKMCDEKEIFKIVQKFDFEICVRNVRPDGCLAITYGDNPFRCFNVFFSFEATHYINVFDAYEIATKASAKATKKDIRRM